MSILKSHSHGKNRVRLLKTVKNGPKHKVLELTVRITLYGDYDHVYLKGDNSGLVATDTMKNTVYVVAKKHQFDSLESYGLILTKHFLDKYPMLTEIRVDLTEQPWTRATVDGRSHNHGFFRERQDYHTAAVHRARDGLRLLQSGITNLVVLKTTQSAFRGFLRDENTSLPDCDDRVLSTSITADWRYKVQPAAGTDFNAIFEKVRGSLLDTFFGPADKGTFSPSVQTSMYEMGGAVLKAVAGVAEVTLDMPNIHFLPVRSLANHGLEWTGEIHMPTDEPHGTIMATIAAKL